MTHICKISIRLFVLGALALSPITAFSQETEAPPAATEPVAEPAIPAQVSAPAPAVTIDPNKFKWAGDLRYRLANSKESTDDARPFQQLRARLGMSTEVSPDVTARIRMATSTSAISANQTLGDSKDPGFARRTFGLDIGALEWQATDWLQVTGGRIVNPFWSPNKSQIIYDSDLAFEGTALSLEKKFGDYTVFGNIGGFIISENYDSSTKSDVVDTGILGIQLGAKAKIQDVQITAHIATQQFLNIQDAIITSLDSGAKYDQASSPYNRFKGNRIYYEPVGQKYYMESKYILNEVGFEAKTKVAGFDVLAFGDFVTNTGSSTENQAHEFGVGGKWGKSSLTYSWIRKDSDSVVAAFTDSDTSGGGTENEGTRINYAYQFSKNSSVGVNQFNATRGKDSTARDYSLTQVDFILSF